MPEASLRVLLSHTSDFGDRPARRNSYIDAAFRALDRAEAVVSDMSLLPASVCSPKHVSESLAKDTDLYIGIIGWRYGSPVRESPDVSYTQLEFRAAAEAGVPRLVFLLSDEHKSKDASEPNFDRQFAFRHEIAESGITVQSFGSPEKLAEILFHSIWKPAGWDPAFLRIFLSAVVRAAEGGSGIFGRAVPTVSLTARRVGAPAAAPDVDPLERAAVSDRLVVLGGPGAGKSWLARQAARRAAQSALERIDKREPLDTIELPLLVPIAPFVSLANHASSVWEALVTQAVKELEPFLPNHRSMGRIRRTLEHRTNRYFIVLDGLDEAAPLPAKTEQRIFDALSHGGCRLMVTSRTGRWRGLLDMTPQKIDGRDLELDVVELQHLEPDQVLRLIQGAVQEQTHADTLVTLLGTHDSLAEAARVPLIAQLITVAGSADTVRDVYDRAINHMLRGEWRATESSDSLSPYLAARSLVENWAWRAAEEQNNTATGLAEWTDAIAIGASASDPVVRSAVDNVVPLVEQDTARLIEWRRFLHRTIRERLVAAHIASLSVDDAAAALEPHLWFDDTWQPIVPAAVAAHPKSTALLRRILVGDLGAPENAMAAFRARDGVGELGDMLVRLRREAPDSIWSDDSVLRPIVHSCFQKRKLPLTHTSDVREAVPIHDQVADWLRTGHLPLRDSIAPQIRTAAFAPAERADLADAVRRWLLGDRLPSGDGRPLDHAGLAIALEALQPDQAVLGSARSQLMTILRDVRRRKQADNVLAAILILRPTDPEREAIAALAIAAVKDIGEAWHLVGLTESLLSLELTTQQRETLRETLLDVIQRERTSTWTRELLRALGSTRPEPRQVAACMSQVLAGKRYQDFDSYERGVVDEGLQDLANACDDRGELLREVIRQFAPRSLDSHRRSLIDHIANRSTLDAQRHAARDVADFIQNNRNGVYKGLELFRLLKTPAPGFVVERLLELLGEPGAPWATIGEEFAKLEATDLQRSAVVEHLLSCLANEPELEVKATAANTLALLRPNEEQRLQALATLRAHAQEWAGLHFEQVIAALAALQPSGTLDPADLRLIIEELERHQSEGTALGFGWAKRLVDVARPDNEMRRRLVAVTMIPADRLQDATRFSFSDRLIDAGIIAGDDEASKRLVGDVCIDALRMGAEALKNGEPLLEPHDVESIFDRLSSIGVPRGQQAVAGELAATLLSDLILHERDRSLVSRICRKWRSFEPPEPVIRQLTAMLLESLRDPDAKQKGRPSLSSALLALEPSSDQRSQVADILIDEIVSGRTEIDANVIERVTISAHDLRRLARASTVSSSLLKTAASRARRSMSLSAWKAILPDLLRPTRADERTP